MVPTFCSKQIAALEDVVICSNLIEKVQRSDSPLYLTNVCSGVAEKINF